MRILFTVEFTVQDGTTTKANYRDFIEKLRVRLGVRFSHNRPVLAIQPSAPNPPTEFFDALLRTNGHSVRLRFRADNLYLLGYQAESGQWWELDNWVGEGEERRLVHLITESGTEWLGFEGSYSALSRAAHRRLEENRLTGYTLESSINNLADSTSSGENRARGLIAVAMMISEATRLIPISNYVTTNFANSDPEGAKIQEWMSNLVKSWGSLSEIVLRADAFPDSTFQLSNDNIFDIPDFPSVKTIADFLGILGVMLGLCYTTKPPSSLSSSCCAACLTAAAPFSSDGGMCYLGSALLQVFSLRITNIDGEDPGQLYGTVKVNDGLYSHSLYDRKSDKTESIKPGQYATLTGPIHPLSAMGQLTIVLLLTDRDSVSADDVIIDDSIFYDAFSNSNVYDKLISHQFSSSKGSATLNYALFRNAVVAQITITIEEGSSWSQVYGHASVGYYNLGNDLDDDDTTATSCLLFERTSDDYAEVRRWQNIPLLRSLLAVPLDTNNSTPLKLTVSLYDYDTFSGDDLIAKGSIDLSVPDVIPGDTFHDIKGDSGNYVSVVVYWTFAL